MDLFFFFFFFFPPPLGVFFFFFFFFLWFFFFFFFFLFRLARGGLLPFFFSFKRFRYLFVSFKSFSCYDDFCLRLGAMWCYIVTIQRKKRKLVRD